MTREGEEEEEDEVLVEPRLFPCCFRWKTGMIWVITIEVLLLIGDTIFAVSVSCVYHFPLLCIVPILLNGVGVFALLSLYKAMMEESTAKIIFYRIWRICLIVAHIIAILGLIWLLVFAESFECDDDVTATRNSTEIPPNPDLHQDKPRIYGTSFVLKILIVSAVVKSILIVCFGIRFILFVKKCGVYFDQMYPPFSSGILDCSSLDGREGGSSRRNSTATRRSPSIVIPN